MADDVFGIVGTTQGGTFEVERVVAEGGFSVVYRAHHVAFRAPVALKCLKVPSDLGGSQREAYLEKFREEAELLFRLSASISEIVRPLHVGTLDHPELFVPFLALEWLEGEALDEILWRRRSEGQAPMSLFKVFKLLSPIASALDRAHRFPGPNGPIAIVHCDVKPENILVARLHGRELVKVLDFGIATAMDAARRNAGGAQTASPDSLGTGFTPPTGAPEQWLPTQFGPTGPWTDVWGLAITLVEALVGEPPIEGDFRAMRQLVLDASRRPTPRTHGVVISDEAEAAFARALAVEPCARTQDVGTFWQELEGALVRAVSLRRRADAAPSSPQPSRAKPIPRVDPTSDAPGPLEAVDDADDPDLLAVAPPASFPRDAATLAVPSAASPPAAITAPPITPPPLTLPSSTASTASPPITLAPSPPVAPTSAAGLRGGVASSPSLDAAGFELADTRAAPFRSSAGMVRARHRSAPPWASSRHDEGSARPASLQAPIRLLVIGVLVSLVDVAFRELRDETLQIASVRPLWVGGALVALGAALFFWRLL